ncbi:cutinase family protein [Gordonia sp. NPDC058843]|uniref:cutinase family protein n=1 Tax=Gordonia sp. NPDC058843 TaxID=3346648 RepID=UPI0036A70A00
MTNWFRRLGACSVALAGVLGVCEVSTVPPVAQAAPCAEFVWIGVAGSGERDGSFRNGGMGSFIDSSYRNFKADAAARGITVSSRAVDYRAMGVPLSADPRNWHPQDWIAYRASMDEGVRNLKRLITTVAAQCGNSQLVLAGYSQGAAVVHRVLQQVYVPRLAGGLLLADPDRLVVDTVSAAGTAAVPVAGAIAGQGIAQAGKPFSGASSRRLPARIGRTIVSHCDIFDPVCSFNPGARGVQFATVATHKMYVPASWRAQLADKLLPTRATAAEERFVGTWAGSTVERSPGRTTVYGTIVDIRQTGNSLGGTITLVALTSAGGTPAWTCTSAITKTRVRNGSLWPESRLVSNPQRMCVSRGELRLTRHGATMDYFGTADGGALTARSTLHKIV